ncbi:MAG TPA: BON domain-containing protein [Nitrospira sp.]|nr:BON domain-containing protein [Nitrospira sp.]
MLIWPLSVFLVLALLSATGYATEESGGDRAKDPQKTVEPKKKSEVEVKSENNGKPGSEKAGAEEKKADDKKAEDKKPDEKKAEDKKAEDKKVEDKKAEDKKADDKKADDKKAEDKKAEDKKPEDKKTEDKKADEKRPDEKKAEEPAQKPEEHKKPVTSLNLAIKLALMADPQLFPLEIEVEMDKGKAVLTGAVPTEEEKGKAAEIAGKVEGVEGVVNKMTVTPALRDKLAKKQDETIAHVVRDRLSRSETLKAVGFDVKSENGIVYLTGKTRFQVIALEAAEAARQVPGVRAVDTAGVQLVAKD